MDLLPGRHTGSRASRPGRWRWCAAAAAVATIGLATPVASIDAAGAPTTSPASATPDSTPGDTTPGNTTRGTGFADNEFLPEDRNLSDCISAVERPGCGSDARGGWRQTAIFVVLVIVLALGGWRIVVVIRRRDKALMSGHGVGDRPSAADEQDPPAPPDDRSDSS